VTRRAAQRVGPAGTVAGLDVNPGMLSVARTQAPPEHSVRWHHASAESMPLADQTFDVVLCQMGLQFFSDKRAALREMRRVLALDGRVHVTVPGPTPPLFEAMKAALARHIDPKAAAFAAVVFSLHDADEIIELMGSAGFHDIDVQAKPKALRLPEPADFLWQYIHSTPLAEPVSRADPAQRDALER